MKPDSAALLCHVPIATSEGKFVASFSSRGLCSLKFPSRVGAKRTLQDPLRLPAKVRSWQAIARRALQRALAGRAPGRLPPLDLSAGTEFQRQVWQALRRIGPGKTRSYSELARAIGHPKAVRAVGGACGANPVPVLVPCHRVLATNEALGGFSAGLNWKRALLRCEGIRL
jgi:O-6-methylguanine DNA methyltransferase